MGLPVLILGESGSGKTCSLRNFEPGEASIMSVSGKPLPFRKRLDVKNNVSYDDIGRELKEQKYKRYIIDDSQYLLAFELFKKVNDIGYGKFTEIALRFKDMLNYIITGIPEDVIVYLLHHTEITDTGKVKAKTVGKMLDNQLTVEGLFSIVLLASADGDSHKFITRSDGHTTCKSPMEMFEREIDNDLKMVDETIRQYYELSSGIKEVKNESA